MLGSIKVERDVISSYTVDLLFEMGVVFLSDVCTQYKKKHLWCGNLMLC